jgi:N-acetyl-beta-hexosaminidase
MLLPVPLRCERLGGSIKTAGLVVREAIAPDDVREPGDEAYRLVVDEQGARLAARTGKGLRFGRATQLSNCAGVTAFPAWLLMMHRALPIVE